jgi:hypothetical protein
VGVDFFVVGDIEFIKDDAADPNHGHDRDEYDYQEHIPGQGVVVPVMRILILVHAGFN